MMGRSLAASGKLPEAARALHCALAARPSAKRRTETLLELSIVQKQRSRFVSTMGALDGIDPRSLTRRQRGDYVLTRARIYRAMGLADKAAAFLRREVPAVADEKMNLAIGLEMAKCHAQEGDCGPARGLLTELLPRMKPGPAAIQAACELAEICLEDGKTAQAISVGRRWLKSGSPAERRRILRLLGKAYLHQRNYQRAALAFAGMLPNQSRTPRK